MCNPLTDPGISVKKIIVAVQIENGPDYGALLGQDVIVCPADGVRSALEAMEAALVVVECGASPESDLELLTGIKQAHPSIPVVFVVETGSEAFAIRAFKSGVRDYFRLPLDDDFVRAITEIPRLRHEFHESPNCVASEMDPGGTGSGRSEQSVHERLTRAVGYVEQHSSESLCLEEVARVACMSKYHFCRLFKKHFGIGLMQYLMTLRIRKTMELLMGSDLPVTLVALKAGFRDMSEFNRQFKKITGITPSTFRKSRTAHS